ncbi:Gfo/Idh/MocA family oxidoreductase [soil metagenome]
MTTYSTAIIGVGAPTHSPVRGGGHQIGYTHAGAYLRHPSMRLNAAADINPANLSAFREAKGEVLGYGDYRQMLRDVRPDVVSICTYVGLHREMIEACAASGVRGVICEKPFVNSPAELVAVRHLVAETGMKIVVTHIRRYFPAFYTAAREFQNGIVGKPLLAFTGLEGWDLSEMGSHHFDLTRMFHGDLPVSYVMGQGRVRNATGYGHAMEDHAIAYIEFDDGSRGLIDGGRGINGGGFSLVGTEGAIHIEAERRIKIFGPNGEEVRDYSNHPESVWESAWDRLFASLIDWMEGSPEPPCGFTSAARSAELNLAAYISMIRGDRVDLPLVDPLDEWPVDLLARRSDEYRLSALGRA